MKFIKDEVISNKKVILRLDLNVTIKDNTIIDDTKIVKSIPTIKYLLENNNKILIMSHLGKVKVESDKANNSLKIVCDRLSELLNRSVFFVPETRGTTLEEALNENSIVLMENTRYEDVPMKLESNCDDELSKYWAGFGDVFVNDAFGTSHRKHASTYGISKYLDSYYGFLIEEELNGLKPIIDINDRPFTVIMGGAKVDDKIALIKTLLQRSDYLLVGGGIANTFLKAAGYEVGKSLISDDYVLEVKTLIDEYKDKIFMPIDVVVKENEQVKTVSLGSIGMDSVIYDIGPKTIDLYKEVINKSKLLFINGTMGLYEDESFKKGTQDVLDSISKSTAIKIAGGGDALASINKLGYQNSFDFISTGGGATLDYIASLQIAIFK